MSAGFQKIRRLQKAGKTELFNKLLIKKMAKTFNHLNGNFGTPLDKSLMEETRIRCWDKWGEYFTEYGFLPETYHFDEAEGEELDRALDEQFRCRCYYPFDCTGQRFTISIHGHRNPNGRISVIHKMGIDI